MSIDTTAPPLDSPVSFVRTLAAKDSREALLWMLRLGAGLCFVGHGAFGIIGKEEWLPYFAIVGIGPVWAFRLMPLVGALDIVVGLLVIARPRPLYLAYMAGWATWTAALRPLTGEPVWELLERAGNYGVPLALLLLVLGSRSAGGEDRSLPRATHVLRWSTALLLFGHGALGFISEKPLLAEHYTAIGGTAGWVPAIGAVEMILAIAVLRAKQPAFFLGVFLWKVATESLFLAAGAPAWEFVERAGSYAAPLALFLLALGSREERRSHIMKLVSGTALAVLFATAILPSTALAQSGTIEVDEPVLVSAGIDHPLTEPHLVVDPTDPGHLLTAAITALEPENRGSRRPPSHITLFQSHDGGRS